MSSNLIVIFTFIIVLTIVRAKFPRQPPGSGEFALGDRSALDLAMESARRLEQRVETLERLLDEDAPGWRARARS